MTFAHPILSYCVCVPFWVDWGCLGNYGIVRIYLPNVHVEHPNNSSFRKSNWSLKDIGIMFLYIEISECRESIKVHTHARSPMIPVPISKISGWHLYVFAILVDVTSNVIISAMKIFGQLRSTLMQKDRAGSKALNQPYVILAWPCFFIRGNLGCF